MHGRLKSKNKVGAFYPFHTVKDGTIWIAESEFEAESIQASFHSYSDKTGSGLRCRRLQFWEDGKRFVRLSFVKAEKRHRRGFAK